MTALPLAPAYSTDRPHYKQNYNQKRWREYVEGEEIILQPNSN
jgi:hypothetical protein